MREPKVFLIGDTHFGHSRIIEYCNRPWNNAFEMNEGLINRWNSVVRKIDEVYVVGDFALVGKDKIIEIGNRLNGRKRIILGNHDGASRETYRLAGFDYVYNHPILLGGKYIISHIPLEEIPEGTVNVYAHVHDSKEYEDCTHNSFCVSAERIDYTPINFEEIKRKVEG